MIFSDGSRGAPVVSFMEESRERTPTSLPTKSRGERVVDGLLVVSEIVLPGTNWE